MPRPTRPHQEVMNPTAPLLPQLGKAVLYPLHMAALTTLAALLLARVVAALLPGVIGWIAALLIWASAYLYALECLRHSANGFARPPEMALWQDYHGAAALFLIQGAQMALLILAVYIAPICWLGLIGLTLLLPAITMSLAFDDALLSWRSPVSWVRAIAAIGLAYAIPVLLGVLQMLAFMATLGPLGLNEGLLWTAVALYLAIVTYHINGTLLFRSHQRLGLTPESDLLAEATGRHADDDLLTQARLLEHRGDAAAAREVLAEQIYDRQVTHEVHLAYRRLLRAANDREELLRHGQWHIAALMGDEQFRRALGVLHECQAMDPAFLPEMPEHTALLAQAAADGGMWQTALKLARAYPNTWPQAPDAARCGLLAARILAEQEGRTAEALVLAGKLAAAYPHDPARADIDTFLQHYAAPTSP
ncbi:hypothetical protein [Oleiagrimonas sp. C23AA]|uniref:hypothetical protein n=1 Tax=Oleiagrimonas sp. C23AA TaxID=2719047 RepID=UPI001424885C|nr:hypothetical protein [Oleiagrimonas sp. C23AA]NII10115.1 hypothetical protein [Oleiagrimonas sp. C23AA]